MSHHLSRNSNVTMQSEIFVTIMVVIVLLFVISIMNMRIAIKAKADAEDALAQIKNKEQPPLIILDETQNYTFKTGSGKLSSRFKSALRDDIIPQLDQMSMEYDCDVIEVYGYTDGQAYNRIRNRNRSQMDNPLLTRLENDQFPNLNATSNLELGILRAASIVHFLKTYQSQDNKHLQKAKIIRPYSGGQLILPSGEIASASYKEPDPSRRRIELRLSRSRDLHKKFTH